MIVKQENYKFNKTYALDIGTEFSNQKSWQLKSLDIFFFKFVCVTKRCPYFISLTLKTSKTP